MVSLIFSSPSLMTMVPTLIASSIGAGWAPQSRGTLSDPAHYDPSKSSAAFLEGELQIHPNTKPDDALYRTKWGDGIMFAALIVTVTTWMVSVGDAQTELVSSTVCGRPWASPRLGVVLGVSSASTI
ncbi:uncharacterized protein EDB93DRAFT_1265758 [Suillus bovinus]|uniref:uncharacterized protein n=1 Tax=Suillus bovinus TaxID=48563 RepID=UPI001B886287|nr:uncharacterized protein EDB93DRAFT_1265758 [Suillus bovinus]KAG2129400.1 hypothetical protein EDB93DRAFT_1265758 [Suillus bovinus]